ncbi:CHAD domain-containing protein [Propionibacteriaceae bacterium G57]|uniref:CYTH and CHAD domain-containing protein n=1 Tax=Aestuariimicrobium sp. G57 TaxID=3418485 RepID=UPI003DA724A4
MEQVETERKYVLGDDADGVAAPVPDLITLPPGYRWGASRDLDLVADYVDTPDLALLRSGHTLRRREGGDDAGWHLKLPKHGDSRVEVRAPLEDGRSASLVPPQLRARVDDVVDRAPLVGVARLVTHRVESEVVRAGPDAQVVALVADDRVRSEAPLARRSTAWHEVEVELVEGTPDDLAELDQALLAAGLTAAGGGPKLAHALGVGTDDAPRDRRAKQGSGAEVVLAHLGRQVGMLQALAPGVREDAPDTVHKSRVATRRLRSTLGSFGKVVDASATQALRDEVRWWGQVLGAPRDAEVLQARLVPALDALPDDQIAGDVRERLSRQLAERHGAAHAELVEAMDGERAAALMEALVDLLVHPPLGPQAKHSAQKVHRRVGKKVRRRVEKARREAAAASGAERLERLHDVRKRAKAARYAHEAFGDLEHAGAKQHAQLWEGVTESLGDWQDTVVAEVALRQLAAEAAAAGQPTATHDVLIADEQQRGRLALVKATRQLEELAPVDGE